MLDKGIGKNTEFNFRYILYLCIPTELHRHGILHWYMSNSKLVFIHDMYSCEHWACPWCCALHIEDSLPCFAFE